MEMDLKALKDTPPWDWPAGTAEKLVNVLRDEQAIESDRLLATEMAGDFTVVNDELVEALLAILRNSQESKQVRARAAISLGPILEYADTEGFDDAGDAPISKRTLQGIQESLHQLYRDADIPKEVRRRILEASVRAPQEWHENAVRSAYSSGDHLWKLTAVFCMRFLRGFDEQIVEELDNKNPDIHLEAALAAGSWGVEAAWPHIAALIHSGRTPKPLLLAAIGIYGLMAYSVGQRTYEIGIRMAMGAKSQDVMRMIVREGMKMALIGAAIGFAMSLPLPKVFGAIFFDMHVSEPRLYIGVPLLILAVSMLATYIPARRAARLDPIHALRQD